MTLRVVRMVAVFGACVSVAACASASGITGSDAGAEGSPGAQGGAGDDASTAHDGSTAGNDSGGSRGDALPPIDGATSVQMGGPGCGLPSAAFCDTFDTPAAAQGRAGELDARWWSASRIEGSPSDPGLAFPVAPATLLPTRDDGEAGTVRLPPCRAGLPAQESPDHDTLVCDSSSDIHSGYLLAAVASQNYGSNSYRIRQPFDFAGRTGKIVFDAEAFFSGLLGWVSVELTDEPISSPGFSLGRSANPPYGNDEGEPPPRNGFEVQLSGGPAGSGVLGLFSVFSNYVEADSGNNFGDNLANIQGEWGKLNHFEVDVSAQKVDIYGTPASTDGVTFAAPQLIFSQAVQLPFTRGYVHVTVHNHATEKYTAAGSAFQNGFSALDAWVARFDNVGFDGPIVDGWREYEVPDALVPGTMVTNLGWKLPDFASGSTTSLQFHGVDPSGMTQAKIGLLAWYCLNCATNEDPSTFDLKYRLNGKTWHDRPYNAGELAFQNSGATIGTLAEMLDAPVGELVPGDNTLELATVNVPQNYQPAVTDVDLVLNP